MTLPVRSAFSATAPRVAFDHFHQFHDTAYLRMIGRRPSAFERATSSALKETYSRMPKGGRAATFTALSAATGAGKTTSACALMAFLMATEGKTCAYVAPTLAVAEEVHRHLLALVGRENRHIEGVFSHSDGFLPAAAYSSIHKANASPRTLDQYAEQGVVPSRQYTAEEFRRARLVITTHERWRHELATGEDLGVLKCNGQDRALVLVDEEPDLERTAVRQPEDVSALASLFADVELKGEARAFGFTSAHHAAETLVAVHGRMRDIKDNSTGQFLQSADVVTEADLEHLNAITEQDITARVYAIGGADTAAAVDLHLGTLAFLRFAGQGRVFYSRGEGGAFYAYGSPVAPQPRHLILDGTADLNGMYAVGRHVTVVSSVPANYERVRLFAVQPPKEFKGRMRSRGILRNDTAVRDYLDWFMPFLIERTQPGQHVLVYCKKALLDYGVHRLPEFNERADRRERYVTELQGRVIHWCSFGRGRGLNEWKDCSAYFRLGDFMLQRAVVLSRIGATTGERFTADDLRRLNSGAVRDARIDTAQAAHCAVTNKQDAARICIRHLDDDGRAKEADLFMVDCDMGTLQAYRERMFPGAGQYGVIRADGSEAPQRSGVNRSPKDGAAARVAELLLTTELDRLTVADLTDRCGLRSDTQARTLSTAEVRTAMQARGWTETTRRALGMPGKGKVLTRSATRESPSGS